MANTKMINQIDRLYAQSLLDLAQQRSEDSPDSVAQTMRALAELCEQSPDLLRLVSTPTVSHDDRRAALERIFRKSIDDLVYRFLQVLNNKDRLNHLPAICEAYAQVYAEAKGIVEVEAHVAVSLGGDQASQVAESLGQALKKTVDLKQSVDPALIGGLKLRVGDRMVDGSVATQLKLLREKMVKEGRQRARQAVLSD